MEMSLGLKRVERKGREIVWSGESGGNPGNLPPQPSKRVNDRSKANERGKS